MTDDHQRNRHRDGVHPPVDGFDEERLRYFTQAADGKPTNRHRRRRAPGAPGTGGFAAMPETATSDDAATSAVRRTRPPEPEPRSVVPSREPAIRRHEPAIRRHEPEVLRPEPRRPEPEVLRPEPEPRRPEPAAPEMLRRERPVASRPLPVAADTSTELDLDPYGDVTAGVHHDDHGTAHLFSEAPATETRHVRGRRSTRSPETRKRRRIVLAVVIACLLALVGSVGYLGMRESGMFISHKDYTNAAGTADVIVDLPENSTIADFANILEQKDVVGSVSAFITAAGNQPMSGGYYKLRTEIPAATAVQMITDTSNAHRVGRVVIPEGLQLDSKQGIDGKTTPGIFEMIADATEVSVNGTRQGVSVAELEKAASDASPTDLGVPAWAESAVTGMDGDHRRIEGLIAPGTWEAVDPTASATQILHYLITASAGRFEQWGLLNDNGSGLTPYQSLVAASVVEREVAKPDDYPKVARVILNRLAKGQRLEMDSTANYTAAVTDIDVHGTAYQATSKWNTYQIKGLPVTPIGAVGQRALVAVDHPANGSWLYFVTIDRNGTTLFADTFDEHQANREKACENKLLTTGCS